MLWLMWKTEHVKDFLKLQIQSIVENIRTQGWYLLEKEHKRPFRG